VDNPSNARNSARGANPKDEAELARALRAQLATVTGGLAPDAYANAWWDWYLNLARQPTRQLQLLQDAMAKAADSWGFTLRAATGQTLAPSEGDEQYKADAWAHWPFNVYAHNYRNLVGWWQQALADVPGVAASSERTLDFLGRNTLEAVSPANYLLTNPELLEATRAEQGQNLVRGFGHWLEDVERTLAGKPAAAGEKFVLIIPAWIMKYYILDLSPGNSLVRYLVSQGHTVFMVSWRNPDAGDRDLGMDDYLSAGIRAAIDAVASIVPERGIHAVGYCIGGTLLSIAAAALAAQGDRRLASVSLLAAQTDFSEPGELSVFISPSQLDMLEAAMDRTGVLKSEQMSGAFALLRSRDLLWTPAVNSYLRGQRSTPNDLMAWNADGTRMPCRMHSEYLRELYLNNALARGEFHAAGQSIDLAAINVPMFVVGTETDHVAPWQSVYKARGLTRSSDYTFLLTSGGHNAGIVSGPVHPRRRHRVRSWSSATETLTPQAWFATTEPQAGSWWPTWEHWLSQHSSGVRVAPPAMGGAAAGDPPLADAPGQYVLQK
jgi:polyhydroxyalkanoate synthase